MFLARQAPAACPPAPWHVPPSDRALPDAARAAARPSAAPGRLVERGYSGTTTQAVCREAGVSHGSLLHHFGTREQLLGAALEAVYARLRGRVVAGPDALPAGDARVEVVGSAFCAPEFKAVVELWLAAANQPDVSWAAWPEARAFDAGTLPLAKQLFPVAAARLSDFGVYVSLVFQVLQGMGLVAATLPREAAGESLQQGVRALLSRIVREA